MKAEKSRDITINGPQIAALALAAGLVDEICPIICPIVLGGGKRFTPPGLALSLQLLGQRSFGNSCIALRYAVVS
jgi:riboflavin biosynthesis pyrimidine reductase